MAMNRIMLNLPNRALTMIASASSLVSCTDYAARFRGNGASCKSTPPLHFRNGKVFPIKIVSKRVSAG